MSGSSWLALRRDPAASGSAACGVRRAACGVRRAACGVRRAARLGPCFLLAQAACRIPACQIEERSGVRGPRLEERPQTLYLAPIATAFLPQTRTPQAAGLLRSRVRNVTSATFPELFP